MQNSVTAGAGTMDDGSARSMGGQKHAGAHDGGPDRSNEAAQEVHRRAAEATTQRSSLQPVTGAQLTVQPLGCPSWAKQLLLCSPLTIDGKWRVLNGQIFAERCGECSE